MNRVNEDDLLCKYRRMMDLYLEEGLLAGPDCFAEARRDYVNLYWCSILGAQIYIDL